MAEWIGIGRRVRLLVLIIGLSCVGAEAREADDDLHVLKGVITQVYGTFPKTAEHEAADRQFIEDVLSTGTSREAGREYALGEAWRLYGDGDEQSALKRFNQAWLLTPNHPEAFHGFAVYMLEKGNVDEAITLSKKALALDPRHARAMCTLARAYGAKAYARTLDDAACAQYRVHANELFEQASQSTTLDEDLTYIYYHWAKWRAREGDMTDSADKIALYRKHGGGALVGEWLIRALARPGKRGVAAQ